jgi:hypothetical protein
MFGDRTLGRPLENRGAATGTPGTVSPGVALGTTMFDRSSLRSSSFVGANPAERETFVGRSQGTVAPEAVSSDVALRRSRAEEIVRRRAQNANLLQLQQGSAAGPAVYAPRLAAGFASSAARVGQVDRRIEASVARTLQAHGWDDVQVRAQGGRVVLAGKVATVYERELIETALQFEPGVESVDNRLQTPAAR